MTQVRIRNNQNLLECMQKDMLLQKELYKPTPYWATYVERIVNGIKESGLESFRSNWRISKGYADPFLMDPTDLINNPFKHKIFRITENILMSLPIFSKIKNFYNRVRDWHIAQSRMAKSNFYRILMKKMKTGILKEKNLPDTLLGNPSDIVSINDHSYAPLYIELAYRIQVASSEIPFEKVSSMFEIGGGFGANAHLMLHLYPNLKKIVIVDIPPVLFVSTEYLRAFYGDGIYDYRMTRKMDSISFKADDSLEIFMLAPWQLENFKCGKVDLFWNTASFQEMERDVVENYVRMIKRMNPFWIYLYTLRDGLITNRVGQREPIDQAFLSSQFDPEYNFKEIDDQNNPYETCVHLSAIKY